MLYVADLREVLLQKLCLNLGFRSAQTYIGASAVPCDTVLHVVKVAFGHSQQHAGCLGPLAWYP